ncbi:tRNA uridine-5-carboxymethylaminomethyl(34) synthesis GTPase MnmE [Larkinella terrae]|uniref:tRNA modification GTPase MnmE n=1 Tax=Larkinella terrae TaxID=2025311 RepID=A0A7K0EDC7_9BACT|nr:tRNA uridine-5-carboxymethylaminomethyl(34) synthesis GTPase MnmE [Larkinella terrae]MRS59785.1 tRNA uridine-5-carboxymethylaminomethyl(34) synthesis GTPase MnmE [Larkinella terrae]
MTILQQEPIAALATAPGIGAIAVIRVSGTDAIELTNRIFRGKDLTQQPSHTVHFGTIRDSANAIIDEVLVSIFRSPSSFTKEDVVEISCHGSDYVIRQILRLLLKEGVRMAQPGEFTQRAFLNGQFDLVQAEAVADLIAADSEATHRAALTQLRGGFSKQLKALRQQLVEFAALIELELDFGEEDVEFAKRDDLRKLVLSIQRVLRPLIDSFSVGNAIKNGVATVIAGKPNAGKSTLLNALLNEEKAIVSDIPGTTRDVIEDEVFIDGIRFRLIDTAGLREATDTIEAIGVERTKQQLDKAAIIIYLFDAAETTLAEITEVEAGLKNRNVPYLLVGNKMDKLSEAEMADWQLRFGKELVLIQANTGKHLDKMAQRLSGFVKTNAIPGSTVVTNLRHFEHLAQTDAALVRVLDGIDDGTTQDWIALELRDALRHLGELTGEITTDDLLATIFSKFCIGK